MNVFVKMVSTLNGWIQNQQKARVMRIFSEMSDRQLSDIGISRELLNKGIKAYPWHAPRELQAKVTKTADVVAFPVQQETVTTAELNPRLAA